MFLELSHTKLEVFKLSKEFVLTCYKAAQHLPTEERYSMIQQIRRAALSVHLNIAEGCSRKSLAERKRYYEIARGSLIEIDTAFDVAISLNYITEEALQEAGNLILRCFQMLSKLIAAN
ncbi:MAG: four helix bundle protein [Chitinophagaceae bacterium]